MLNEGGEALPEKPISSKSRSENGQELDGLNFTPLAYTVFICPLPPLPLQARDTEVACSVARLFFSIEHHRHPKLHQKGHQN